RFPPLPAPVPAVTSPGCLKQRPMRLPARGCERLRVESNRISLISPLKKPVSGLVGRAVPAADCGTPPHEGQDWNSGELNEYAYNCRDAMAAGYYEPLHCSFCCFTSR